MNESLDAAFRPWHREIAGRLLQTYTDGLLAHAIVFAGAQGLGKLLFADALAAKLLCESVNNELEVCGQCAGCGLVTAGTHPDFYRLGPPEGKHQIPVALVREVKGRLLQSAQIHRNKVCVINPADYLNESASNALLKLLEEPPADTYFLLVSDQYSTLSPTIRSRCMRVLFKVPDRSKLETVLQLNYPRLDTSQAVDLSRGFPEIAISLLQESNGEQQVDFGDELLALIGESSHEAELVKKISADDLTEFLKQFYRSLVLAISMSISGNHSKEASESLSLSKVATGLATRYATEQLYRMYEIIVRAMRARTFNPNNALFVENLVSECLSYR